MEGSWFEKFILCDFMWFCLTLNRIKTWTSWLRSSPCTWDSNIGNPTSAQRLVKLLIFSSVHWGIWSKACSWIYFVLLSLLLLLLLPLLSKCFFLHCNHLFSCAASCWKVRIKLLVWNLIHRVRDWCHPAILKKRSSFSQDMFMWTWSRYPVSCLLSVCSVSHILFVSSSFLGTQTCWSCR